MPTFDYSEFPTLRTERLVLRELRGSDAEDLFAVRSDPYVQRYNSVPHTDVSESAEMIERLTELFAKHEWIHWGVALRENDKLIGLYSLGWNEGHRRAEIGYDLNRAYWGKRLASEALGAMLAFAFDVLEVNRLEAQTIADNHESTRLLRKFGFQLEGVRRGYSLEEDGEFHGGAIYGLLRSEYEGGQA
ncbi:GNAT family N-acetyltransferase [Tenggerimyces flavus]|uniref:GNAT family N-acetyltransferase n=1 Tax=Tenggerimyces flavus TaxID=1708749 RepID=A0ABV7YAJ7_9ACTN|nr:GNAT family N-acetyltransferase [Tenggerimyces flavus]MBM7785629.1 ribosomal-protein-alanine N-acetyltransferase [Tenggerimyces flavus]